MSLSPRARLGFLPLLALLIPPAMAGCGDDGYGRRHPVYGTVSHKGEPLERGRITFTPTAPEGRPASGEIRDGAYELTTVDPDDGALAGSYKVSVMAVAVDDSEVLANAGGGVGNQMDVIRANQAAVPLIPPKYQLADTSGLTAEVEEGSNELNFDLPAE
ncbi:hypothetical protein [Tautonia plasticadhaerens]|uniref:Carboxypeptidase regulatory-like domain-containing protein n=1 Tax=Tautonia plasticadhaerens TaxID=2527974 RepID=A0A518H378_9BACT|nr:hypothetical protein [Tautonia plasticadhaerens]QDV35293.1 hypothetical protein ElP_31960 [Tautonia plasticadhaerens]